MLQDLDEGTMGALLEIAGPGADTPVMSIEVRDYRSGGTEASVTSRGPGAHDGFAVYATGILESPHDGAGLDGALAHLQDAMRPHARHCVLLNLLGDGDAGAERTHACFTDDEYTRLQEIKRRYDPTNRFRFNHNIAP
jgi:hypothetical protein